MDAIPPPEGLLRRLREGQRFLITSHTSPDGDAIGSELALARVLADNGREAVVWNADPAPAILQSIEELAAPNVFVGIEQAPSAQLLASCDALILLECPTEDRCGLTRQLPTLPRLNIDHHLGNPNYGAENWVDVEAPAVGEMLWRLATELGWTISPRAAHFLYLALASDTGGFRFSNATARAFRTGEALVSTGASPEQVAHLLYEQNPLQWVRLLARMLDTLALSNDGTVATVVISQQALERSGASREHTEGLIDIPRSIAGVRAVALLREIGEHEYKVSLRSRGTVDVEQVARSHGGGGHRNAAGCAIAGQLRDVRAQVERSLVRAVELATQATDARATAQLHR